MSNTPVGANKITKANRRVTIWKALSLTIDLFLIAITSLGCYYALQASWKKSELDFHLNQLADKTEAELSRDFVVVDPDRVYVKAIATDSPLEFAWRVYLPKGFQKKAMLNVLASGMYKSATNVIDEPIYGLARFKIKQMGEYVVCEQNWLGEITVLPSNIHESRDAFDFLNRSDFGDALKQVGKDQVQSFSKDDDLELLVLSLSISDLAPALKAFGRDRNQIKFSLRDKFP